MCLAGSQHTDKAGHCDYSARSIAQIQCNMVSLRNPRLRTSESVHEAVQLRDEVLAIVAHDLRSPISTILMATELLRHRRPEQSSAEFLDIIAASATQADALIRDLVDVTRLEAGHFAIALEREPLGTILCTVVGLFVHQSAKAGVILNCDCTNATDLIVAVDHSRFTQLLSNLIDNAIKFTAPGGTVWITATPENDVVRISVQDTGIGINEDELAHVFDRFWQSNRHHRAGSGLGLAITKGIVEAHGGEIHVVSEEGVGSTFDFTLPLVLPVVMYRHDP